MRATRHKKKEKIKRIEYIIWLFGFVVSVLALKIGCNGISESWRTFHGYYYLAKMPLRQRRFDFLYLATAE